MSQIRLAGSRAQGRAGEHSDWDFLIKTPDFPAIAAALPELLAPLDPLTEQWDRLSTEWCWMLIVPGPVKVDLIFPDEPHPAEPPWEPAAENLPAIDAHFWDWILWLTSKEARGKAELVDAELDKLFEHLLEPLGVASRPSSLRGAIDAYREARGHAERILGVNVPGELEAAVVPVVAVGELRAG